MEMFYLVLFWSNAMVVMPETYPLDQCQKAGKEWSTSSYNWHCIPAPKLTIMKPSLPELFDQCKENEGRVYCGDIK